MFSSQGYGMLNPNGTVAEAAWDLVGMGASELKGRFARPDSARAVNLKRYDNLFN